MQVLCSIGMLHRPRCLGTHYLDLAGLKLTEIPLPLQVLGLKLSTTVPGLNLFFKDQIVNKV